MKRRGSRWPAMTPITPPTAHGRRMWTETGPPSLCLAPASFHSEWTQDLVCASLPRSLVRHAPPLRSYRGCCAANSEPRSLIDWATCSDSIHALCISSAGPGILMSIAYVDPANFEARHRIFLAFGADSRLCRPKLTKRLTLLTWNNSKPLFNQF